MFMRETLPRDAHSHDGTVAELTVTVDGRKIGVARYTTVAAALAVAQGIGGTRVSAGGAARAPFCGMGVCHECRVTVDGRAYVLACQTICRDDMRIETELARS